MTAYLSAYDTESVECLKCVEVLVEVHRKYEAPATFFIVGRLLEDAEQAKRYRELLVDELFDVQSHTYSHQLLKDIALYGFEVGRRPSLEAVEQEVVKANKLIAKTFGQEVIGLRTPNGHFNGLKGEKEVLNILWRNGIKFLSSDLRGPFDTIPGTLNQPYRYSEDGYPDLLELPGHDWHDNVLKGYTSHPTLWPPQFPWNIPPRVPQTPAEEFEVYKPSLDYAIENNLIYYSPIFHPHAIYRMSQEAKTIDLLLGYAKERGLVFMNFRQMYGRLLESLKVKS